MSFRSSWGAIYSPPQDFNNESRGRFLSTAQRRGAEPLPSLNEVRLWPANDAVHGSEFRAKLAEEMLQFGNASKFLDMLSKEMEVQHIGVFGVRQTDGQYAYTYGSFGFNAEVSITNEYTIIAYATKDSLGVQRIALARVPKTDRGIDAFLRWLYPVVDGKNPYDRHQAKQQGNSIKDCVSIMVEPAGWITLDGKTYTYHPPVYQLDCFEDNPPIGSDGGSGSGEAGGGGGSGGWGNECSDMFKWGCEDVDEDLSDLDKPCATGDPIKNPTIAAQKWSGINGGRFGFTRKDEQLFPKMHWGLDLANPIGASVYSAYAGKVISIRHNVEGFGTRVIVETTLGGLTFRITYAHLDPSNVPVVQGQTISALTMIGTQGTSGNLANGIKEGTAIPHVHVQVEQKDMTTGQFFRSDPEHVLRTNFDTAGNPRNHIEC